MSTYLMPDFIRKFRCVADACDDNCCHGWKVYVDKATFQKYRSCGDMDFGNELREKTARIHDAATGSQYAEFVMSKDGNCPFFNDKGLCRIQLVMDEDMLPLTCKRYPHIINSIDGVLEVTAQLSCPVITRAVMTPAEPMSFSFASLDRHLPLNNSFNPSEQLNNEKPERFFTELRKFGISILQNRAYTVPERLVLLGVFFNQLSEEGDSNNIPLLIENTRKQHGNVSETKQQLSIIQAVPSVQIKLLKLISDHKNKASSNKYQDIQQSALRGLGYIAGASEEQILDNYISGIELYVKPFFSEHGHMIENVLVYEYFLMMMPFGSFETVLDAYAYLIVLYGLIKFFMAGVAREKGYMDVQITQSIVQSIAREILHNEHLIKQVIHTMQKNDLFTLAYMTILVMY